MANLRRKEANRFKFVPFTERISQINVDVFHRVSHRNEESESENRTYFQEAVEKWTVLNRTKEWIELSKLVVADGVITLPQLLNQKDKIAELFVQHIPKQTEHSLQPVLELLAAFVKDLRNEFYPYYPRILQQLVKLLKTRNPDIIEHSFVCLAFIFKYLARNLVKDLDLVLLELAPLLDEAQPEYVREFAAESFAFVARRVKDKPKLLTLVLATVQKHPQLTAGCGRLVMETMYGIKGQPHSSAKEMLHTTFGAFGAAHLPQALLFELTHHITAAYLLRIESQHSNIVSVILDVLKEKLNQPDLENFEKSVRPLLSILVDIVEYRGGIHVARDARAVAEAVVNVCLVPRTSGPVRALLPRLVVRLLTAICVKLPQENATRLVNMMLQQPKELVLEFVESACHYGGFESTILPSLLGQSLAYDPAVIITLAKIVSAKLAPKPEWTLYPLKFKDTTVPQAIVKTLTDMDRNSPEVTSCVFLLPHISPLDPEEAMAAVARLITSTVVSLKDDCLLLVYLAMESMSHMSATIPRELNSEKLYMTLVRLAKQSFLALKSLELWLELLVRDKQVPVSNLSQVREVAIASLTSPHTKVRASALHILRCVEQLQIAARDALVDGVLDTCLEELGGALNHVQQLRRIETTSQTKSCLESANSSSETVVGSSQGSIKENGMDTDPSGESVSICRDVLDDVINENGMDADPSNESISTCREVLDDVLKEKGLDTDPSSESISICREVLDDVIADCEETFEGTGIDKLSTRLDVISACAEGLNGAAHSAERLRGAYPDVALLPTLNTCLAAETVPLTLHTYRDALVHVRDLYHDHLALHIDHYQIPFRFLLGYLFSKLSLIETEVIQAIQSYDSAKSSNIWAAFKEQLTLEGRANDVAQYSQVVPHLKDWMDARVGSNDFCDLYTYKGRLWKALTNFSLDEAQEKDVIDIVISQSQNDEANQSLKRSLLVPSAASVTTVPASQETDSDATAECDGIVVTETSVGTDLDEKENIPTTVMWQSRKLLVTQLDVVTKTRSHSTLKYRKEDMTGVCMKGLLEPDPPLRRSSVLCLAALTPKLLSQYLKALLQLTDEDGFKAALVHFQLDAETGEVKEAHRSVVMPIVLRLLYSKMVSNASTQRGNKTSALTLRRKQVMRFLAACQETEVKEFLAMAFSFLDLDPAGKTSSSAIAERMLQVSRESVSHVRKLQSCVGMAGVVLKHLGGHLTPALQTFLLQVLLSVMAVVTGLLALRESIPSGFLPSLKKLRGTSLVTLTLFFDKFPGYPWTEDDVAAVFRTAVWPSAHKLAVEGIHSPTPLLKLFQVWSEHPRYFVLFARHMEGDTTQTPLTYMMELLMSEKCHQTVSAAITAILERLLTLQDDVAMETDDAPPPQPLEIESVRPIDTETLAKLLVNEELNYGSKLLVPHVGTVLEVLRRELARGEKRALDRSQTAVLARVTEMATCGEHGDALLGLLLRVLATRPPSDEEVLVNTLLTVQHLLVIVTRPLNYLRSMAILFGVIEPVQGRKALVACMEQLGTRSAELATLAATVRDLNAYDRRWLDQCDFNRRLDTFKSVRQMAALGQLPLDTATFVIHTAFFFLKTEKDLSIRDSTELCLKEMCPKLLDSVKNNEGECQFITETLLKAIMGGVQGKDERFKASAIALLGVLARECPSAHFVLKDLSLFTNAADLEVDLFENIHHLQLYRRNRALLKLASVLKSLKQPISVRTVTQFLMPLSNQFLCSETYAGKNSLVDAAIECVGTLCRLLPWYQYQSVLKYYLGKLRTQIDYQRQCVRLVTAILDAFHFDISHASEVGVAADVSSAPTAALDVDMERDEAGEEIAESVEVSPEVSDVVEDILDAVVAESGQYSAFFDREHDADSSMDVDSEEEKETLLVETMTVLKPGPAARVLRAISGPLMEQLYKAIGERTVAENTHKVNRKALGPHRDEEDILRVAIAVTLVKLLQKLPAGYLDTQLPGILTKLCTFLKSPLESVRRVTRETLQQVMTCVGPAHLPLLLAEMTSLLTKGFQRHVLVFTIHAVIQALQPLLQPGDVDPNLPTILQVCSAELFGDASDEKAVVRMQVKHKEVRSTKSYHLLHLLAQLITDKALTDLIIPIKQALSGKTSHKLITKCRECLRQIVLGLAINKTIPPQSLFVFVYGVTSESIPQLQPTPPPPPRPHNPKERQDCLLLAPEPTSRRVSAPVKSSARSGAHLIIEFGLHLLMLLLTKDRVKKLKLAPLLDPVVPILRSALESHHVKVSMLGVKCLTRMLPHGLPSLKEHIKPILTSLFSILHKYAVAGLGKGDNFDLILAVFKMMSTILREMEYATFTSDQLRTLLLYAENDIHDNSRQAVAFGLLKAILHRKLSSPELPSVMAKVAELAVTSELEHVRTQARQTMLHYMMDYPLGKKLDELLGFFIGQMSYDVESGRLSAIEMMFSLINSFPLKVLQDHSELFLLSLGARLVNEDSADCKKAVAAAIGGMLQKLQPGDRDNLFQNLLVWLKQKKLVNRGLAVQLVGIFVKAEKAEFERRLSPLLPLIVKQLTRSPAPGQFVRLPRQTSDEDDSLMDYHLYLVLVLLCKLVMHCPAVLTIESHREDIATLTDTAQSLLAHEHEWVRVGSAQFLGTIFSSIKPQQMAAVLNGGEGDIRYWDPTTFQDKVRSLILDHTAQFMPGVEITQEFTDQLLKNLVYFAKVLKDVKAAEDDEGQAPNLRWLVRRMRKIVQMEVARTPGTNTLRSAVFTWTGAVATCLTKEELLPVLYHLAAPLVREAEVAQASPSPAAGLAAEVTARLKKKVGVDEFAERALKIQSKLMENRAKRNTARAQEFVTDPEKAVKRKIERQLKKKENKKRKKEILHGKKPKTGKGKKHKLRM